MCILFTVVVVGAVPTEFFFSLGVDVSLPPYIVATNVPAARSTMLLQPKFVHQYNLYTFSTRGLELVRPPSYRYPKTSVRPSKVCNRTGIDAEGGGGW